MYSTTVPSVYLSAHNLPFAACLQTGYVSSQIGHLNKLVYDSNKPDAFVYLSCIKQCKKVKDCISISYRISTKECWLKSSLEKTPRLDRSFLELSCLEQKPSVLFPRYQHKLDYMYDRLPVCPNGYQDLIHSSSFCYNVVNRSKVSWEDAHDICKKFYHGGELVTIDSSKLNEKYAKRFLNGATKTAWIGWKMSTTHKL